MGQRLELETEDTMRCSEKGDYAWTYHTPEDGPKSIT